MGQKGENRRNRNVVNVDNRLYSPAYDWEGDDGLEWYELSDGDAMCYFRSCDFTSYNAWLKATDKYFNNVLIPHYNSVLKRAEAVYGGAAFGTDIADRFNKISKLINAWDNFDKTKKTIFENYLNPFTIYWRGKTREIVNFFDDAASAVDELNDIAVNDLKSKHLAETPPARTLDPIEGGFLGGSGGPKQEAKGGTMSTIGLGIGLIAIGAAGYFGYKVLTE